MYYLTDPINREMIEDVKSENWEIFHQMNDSDYCGSCLIKKPCQVRHCPMVGLCIPKYHKYSYFFDKPVYFKNEGRYFLLLVLELLTLVLYNWVFFDYVGEAKLAERTFFMRIPWMIFQLVKQGRWFSIWAYFIGSYTLFIKFFHFCVFFYAVSNGTTLDEIYNPHYYPYLFNESENMEGKWIYNNPNDKGFGNNWKLFLKQWKSSEYTTSLEDY